MDTYENEPGVKTVVESMTALRLILCDVNIDVADALPARDSHDFRSGNGPKER